MKVAVITGGSRGIGAAVAKRLRVDGETWRVISVSKHVPAKNMEDQMTHHITADLSMPGTVDMVLRNIHESTEHVNLLVNNAGAITGSDSFSKIEDHVAISSYRLHSVSPLLLAKGLRPLLECGEGSSIVNIGSIYGAIPDLDVVAYTMAKSAMPVITRLMAKAFAPKIRANCVLPGHVDTDMTRSAPSDFIQSIVRNTPLARLCNADEIADAVCFLASAKAMFITGTSLVVDGGYLLHDS